MNKNRLIINFDIKNIKCYQSIDKKKGDLNYHFIEKCRGKKK